MPYNSTIGDLGNWIPSYGLYNQNAHMHMHVITHRYTDTTHVIKNKENLKNIGWMETGDISYVSLPSTQHAVLTRTYKHACAIPNKMIT